VESNWHREVVNLGLQSSGIRVAARQIPGRGIAGVSHWVSAGNGQWTGVNVVTVDDVITVVFVAGIFPWYIVKGFVVPERPVIPV